MDPSAFGIKEEEMWIPSKNSRLHSWYFRSVLAQSKGLVVFFHGNAENLTSHFTSLHWLPKEGYDYLIFDYQGYGQSAGKSSPQSTVEDGVAILFFASKMAKERGVPLILFGQSLGGPILLRSFQAVREQLDLTQIKLIAFDSSFVSYAEAGRSVLSRSWLFWPFQWLSYLLLSDDLAPMAQNPPTPFPWLIFHGTSDSVIDLRLGQDLYRSLPEPKTWVTIPNGKHIESFWLLNSEGRFCYREEFLKALDPRRDSCVKPRARLPFRRNQSFRVLQGPKGAFSHQGEMEDAVDFAMPEGTEVLPMYEGKVVATEDGMTMGGPSDAYLHRANYIRIRHDDGSEAEYFHLKYHSLRVRTGDRVRLDTVIAESGATGFTSEPHLHVRIYDLSGSIPIVFDLPPNKNQVLSTGDWL
jgi:hypothetical protein